MMVLSKIMFYLLQDACTPDGNTLFWNQRISVVSLSGPDMGPSLQILGVAAGRNSLRRKLVLIQALPKAGLASLSFDKKGQHPLWRCVPRKGHRLATSLTGVDHIKSVFLPHLRILLMIEILHDLIYQKYTKTIGSMVV